MSNNTKPEVRFKEFNDSWELRKVDNYASFLTGNGLSWDDISEEGTQECILYGNLYTDYGMIIDNVVYRTNSQIKNPVFSEYGDVLIPASDTTPTGLARASSLEKSGVLLGGDINIIRPNKMVNGSCLSLTLNSNKKELLRLIKGTTVRHIHNSEIKDIIVSLPSNKNEQEKIASYFKKIDKLILLLQIKHEKLKNIKKTMLEKMFPIGDETKPQLRFKGFNDSWIVYKFGEMADYKKGPFGSAITKDMFVPKTKESIKVYEQQNAINKDWKLERYFLPKDYVLTKLKSFEVHGGDIIVSCAGTIGEIYEIPSSAESGIINQALMRIRLNKNKIDKNMFKIVFSNMINEFTRVHSNGSAIKNIPPFADLKPMEVLIPSLEEQKKIAKYFTNLDKLINLYQQKYEKLTNIKKSLLEKMFV